MPTTHTITLDTEELERLMKLVYLGHWMVNAIRADDYRKDYEAIERLVLRHAYEAGMTDLVTYDVELKKHFPTWKLEMESDAEGFRQEYDEHIFWENLHCRLVDRDVERKYGRRKFRRMTPEERWAAREPHEDYWDKELERHGIDRLGVVE